MAATGAVIQHQHFFRPGSVSDHLHFFADEAKSLVPGNFYERLLTIFLRDPHQRLFESVGIEISTRTAGATRAKTSTTVQVVRVARYFPKLVIFFINVAGALPKAHVTNSGRLANHPSAG